MRASLPIQALAVVFLALLESSRARVIGATPTDSLPLHKAKAARRFFSEPAPAPAPAATAPMPDDKSTRRQRLMAAASSPSGFSAPYYNPKNYTVSDFHTLVEGLNSDFHREMGLMEQQNQRMSADYTELEKRLNEGEKRIHQMEELLRSSSHHSHQPQLLMAASLCIMLLMVVAACAFLCTRRMLSKKNGPSGSRAKNNEALMVVDV